jgi:hypothetical protein
MAECSAAGVTVDHSAEESGASPSASESPSASATHRSDDDYSLAATAEAPAIITADDQKEAASPPPHHDDGAPSELPPPPRSDDTKPRASPPAGATGLDPKLQRSDFLFGKTIGEGAYARVVHARLKPDKVRAWSDRISPPGCVSSDIMGLLGDCRLGDGVTGAAGSG